MNSARDINRPDRGGWVLPGSEPATTVIPTVNDPAPRPQRRMVLVWFGEQSWNRTRLLITTTTHEVRDPDAWRSRVERGVVAWVRDRRFTRHRAAAVTLTLDPADPLRGHGEVADVPFAMVPAPEHPLSPRE